MNLRSRYEDLTHVYIVKCYLTSPSPHMVSICCCCCCDETINALNSEQLQVHNTQLTSHLAGWQTPRLVHPVTRSFYLWPTQGPWATTILSFASMSSTGSVLVLFFLIPHISEIIPYWSFSDISLNITPSSSIPIITKRQDFLLLKAYWYSIGYVHTVYMWPFVHQQTFRLFLSWLVNVTVITAVQTAPWDSDLISFGYRTYLLFKNFSKIYTGTNIYF